MRGGPVEFAAGHRPQLHLHLFSLPPSLRTRPLDLRAISLSPLALPRHLAIAFLSSPPSSSCLASSRFAAPLPPSSSARRSTSSSTRSASSPDRRVWIATLPTALSPSPRSVPTKESPRIVLIPLSREDAASLNKSLRQDIDKRLLIYRPVDREGISDTKTMRHHGSRFVESNVRAFIFTPFFPRRRCDGGGVARHAAYFRRNCGYEGLAKEGPGKTRPRAACRGTRRH